MGRIATKRANIKKRKLAAEQAILIWMQKFPLYEHKFDQITKNVIVTCNTHGITSHKRLGKRATNYPCKQCGVQSRTTKVTLSQQEFINRAKSIHGQKYDYSYVNYINSHIKIEILCPFYGSFFQIPLNHLQRTGCPQRVPSSGEQIFITYVTKHKIKFFY